MLKPNIDFKKAMDLGLQRIESGIGVKRCEYVEIRGETKWEGYVRVEIFSYIPISEVEIKKEDDSASTLSSSG